MVGQHSDSDDSRSPSPLPRSLSNSGAGGFAADEELRKSPEHHNNDIGKQRSASPSKYRRSVSNDRSRSRSRTRSPKTKGSRSRSKSRSRSRSRERRRRYSSRSRSRSRSRDRYRRAPTPDDEDDGYRLHVADLDSSAAKRDLEKVYGKYGPLKEIWMARSTPCFAFVVYRYRDDAEEACRMTDGTEILSRRVKVSFARPRTRGRGRRGFDPNMRCYQCGDRGHFSRDCPDSKYGYKRPPSPSRDRHRRERRSSGDRYDRDRRSRY